MSLHGYRSGVSRGTWPYAEQAFAFSPAVVSWQKLNIRVWRSWYRACFGSAVVVSGTGQGETPQSLVTPAFAGLHPVAESGIKAALTTGMTTDRKNFIFTARRGIMAEK